MTDHPMLFTHFGGHVFTTMTGNIVFPVKFDDKSSAIHYLFYKAHQVRATHEEKPPDRTIFIINIPSFLDESSLKRLFGEFGRVERVFVHKEPSPDLPAVDTSHFYRSVPRIQGYRVAYCVFHKKLSLHRALSSPDKERVRIASTVDHPVITGLMRWQMEQNETVVDEAALRTETDHYMSKYDAQIDQERELRSCDTRTPDADGWVLVRRRTGGQDRHAAPNTDYVERSVKQRLKAKQLQQRRKRSQLINLYNFQLKDSKKEQLAKMRQKFEEDKRKIAEMRAQRKFRPY